MIELNNVCLASITPFVVGPAGRFLKLNAEVVRDRGVQPLFPQPLVFVEKDGLTIHHAPSAELDGQPHNPFASDLAGFPIYGSAVIV